MQNKVLDAIVFIGLVCIIVLPNVHFSKPLAPIVPIFRGTIVVDRYGDRHSELLTHEQAIRELERYQSGFYHPDTNLKPFGWENVVLLKSEDFERLRK